MQRIHLNSKKWLLSVRIFFVKMTLRLFIHFLLLWLWHQYLWSSWEDRYTSKTLSQILLGCYSLLHKPKHIINNNKRLVTRTPPTWPKNCRNCTEKWGKTSPWWGSSTVKWDNNLVGWKFKLDGIASCMTV